MKMNAPRALLGHSLGISLGTLERSNKHTTMLIIKILQVYVVKPHLLVLRDTLTVPFWVFCFPGDSILSLLMKIHGIATLGQLSGIWNERSGIRKVVIMSKKLCSKGSQFESLLD